MSGKTAVLALCGVMTALTVCALFLMVLLRLTGVPAALVWLPAFAVMAWMAAVAARTAGRSGSC